MKFLVTCCLLAIVAATVNVSSRPSVVNVTSHYTPIPKGILSQPSHSKGAEIHAKPSQQTAVSAPHRARVDVGFATFEKEMLVIVSKSFQNTTIDTLWTDHLRKQCMENVSSSLSEGLKFQLKPLKMLIGKTWMSLPEEESRDAYVSQLKAAYGSDLKDCLQTVESHLQRSFRHLGLGAHSTRARKASPEELLSRCETSVAGNLMSERCYDVSGEQSLKKAHSFLQIKSEGQNKFCMPSVFEALAHRLHDSQGLIGMTMQFETKSMALQTTPSAVNDIVQQVGALDH
jgi:hypothetical protein